MESITIKTEKEIEIMREGGRILAEILKEIENNVKPGVSTLELNNLAEKLIFSKKAQPAFKGFKGYPATLCVSINDEVVHGIPQEARIIKSGDLVSLDLGLKYKGFYTDAAISCGAGGTEERVEEIIKIVKEALDLAISLVKPGVHLGDIEARIEEYVNKKGFYVVKEFCGHGIGRELHEEPQVLNFGTPGTGPLLKPGMTLCFEPMINEKNSWTKTLPDGWTVKTRDGGLSAHFEHTVLVTEKGREILTKISNS